MHHHELDRYLNTLEARMKHLPKARRADDLREIRQHLETLAAGYRAQGHSEDDAVREAIQQFGRADALAGALNRVWLKQVTGGILSLLFLYLASIAGMFVVFAATGQLDLSAAGLRGHLMEASFYSLIVIIPAILGGGFINRKWQDRKDARA